MARAVNHHRYKERPANPTDLSFEINYDYLQCREFIIGDIQVQEARHILFATQDQLRLLLTKRWFIDGTFKIVDAPFNGGQLMSIHSFMEKDGNCKQVPLMFALMSRRRRDDYVAVFRKLLDVLGTVQVEEFMLDCEQAAWLAVRECFPGAIVKGCVFHWTKAVWARVMDLGLKPAYMQRSSAFNLIRQLLCLPFLPAQHIRSTFLKFAEHERSHPDREKRNRLMDYISRQWLDHPIFDVDSWSVFGYQIRTNNDVEGYHHRLNSRAGPRGLSFYRLVPVLLSECQHAQRLATLIASGSNDGTNRGRQYRHLSQKVKDLFEKYSAGELTTTHYLRACGKLYGPLDMD